MPDMTIIIRNDSNSITIKVSTRKLLSNRMMNGNRIFSILQNSSSIQVLIVNGQFWNLKRSAMWVTNQCYTFAIVIVRSIDLVRTNAVDRENDMRRLTRHSSCC